MNGSPESYALELTRVSSVASSHLSQTSRSPSPTSLVNQIPKFSTQMKDLVLELDENDTIFCCQAPKRWIIIVMVITFPMVVLEATVLQQSLIFSALTSVTAFTSICLWSTKTNDYVLKEALKSFTFWYKVVNLIIAVTARQIYYNSAIQHGSAEPYFSDIPSNVGHNNVLYYFRATLASLNLVLVIITTSVMDGFAIKSNRIKRFGICSVLSSYVLHWANIYFHVDEQYVNNKNRALQISFLGHENYFYWRSMALSSFFKAMTFIVVQLWNNCRRPSKVNGIPLPVKINELTMDDIENGPFASMPPRTTGHGTKKADLQLEMRMPRGVTILFMIMHGVFGVEEVKSFRIASIASSGRCLVACTVLALFNFVLILIASNQDFGFQKHVPWLIIMLHVFQLMYAIYIFVQCNHAVLKFKQKSFNLYWKLYNVIAFFIALFCIRYLFHEHQFEDYFTFGESIFQCIMIVLYACLLITAFSLYQGFNKVGQRCLATCVVFYIVYFFYRSLYHYFNVKLDHREKVLGNWISARNIIISSGIDIVVWLLYQLYQIARYPKTMFLVSKIKIGWVKH